MSWDLPPATKPSRLRLYLEIRAVLSEIAAYELIAESPTGGIMESPRGSKARWLLKWLPLLKPKGRG